MEEEIKENKEKKNAEIIIIKDKLNKFIKEINYFLEQINSNYLDENIRKRCENFFLDISNDLNGINEKFNKFNIDNFKESDFIEKKDHSNSDILIYNNNSFNNIRNHNNNTDTGFQKSFSKFCDEMNGVYSIEEIENNSLDSTISSIFKEVKSSKELDDKDIIEGNKKILSIEIKNEGESFFLLKFINIDFTFLIKLVLKENNIKDISPLLNPSICNLEKLNLENNILDNKCIDVLKKMNLKKLKKLNLYNNKISSIEIFEICQEDNMPSLELLYVGKNPLSEDEIRKNKKTFKYSNLLYLGINEIFNNDTIYFINYLKIENLRDLYMGKNNLISLKCIKSFNFKNLIELWIPNNSITDINEIANIKNKATIKDINLSGNKISAINNNFLKLLDEFSNLESINLKYNQINENDEIIQKIKERGKKVYI